MRKIAKFFQPKLRKIANFFQPNLRKIAKCWLNQPRHIHRQIDCAVFIGVVFCVNQITF